MAIWLIRAGSHGEFEQKFIQDNRVYVTWDNLNVNLGKLSNREEFFEQLQQRYADAKKKRLLNWVSQLWPFAKEIKKGDLVVLPLKSQSTINIGEVTSDYQYLAQGPNPFFHYREVKWVGESIPRDRFGKDLLFTFGAFLTICRVQRNNAEERILSMKARNWDVDPMKTALPSQTETATDETTEDTDLEELALDQIAKIITARFKGHGLSRLVEAILKAQGYTTYLSPEGADGGVDILAGAGPLGFGSPRLCVEVKSQDAPIDRPTIDKLLGAVSKFGAQEGLFVSLSGFKSNVVKELAPSFFKIRLWTKKELLEELFKYYDQLDADLKAELPLKRIWTVTSQEE